MEALKQDLAIARKGIIQGTAEQGHVGKNESSADTADLKKTKLATGKTQHMASNLAERVRNLEVFSEAVKMSISALPDL